CRILPVPGHVQERSGHGASFLLVEPADLQEEAGNNILIPPCLTRRIQGRVLPLYPARRIDERTVFFRKATRGQQEDLGVDGRRIRGRSIILLGQLTRLPEGGRFGLETL